MNNFRWIGWIPIICIIGEKPHNEQQLQLSSTVDTPFVSDNMGNYICYFPCPLRSWLEVENHHPRQLCKRVKGSNLVPFSNCVKLFHYYHSIWIDSWPLLLLPFVWNCFPIFILRLAQFYLLSVFSCIIYLTLANQAIIGNDRRRG